MPAELSHITLYKDNIFSGQHLPQIEAAIKSQNHTTPQGIVNEIRKQGYNIGEGLPVLPLKDGSKTYQVFHTIS